MIVRGLLLLCFLCPMLAVAENAAQQPSAELRFDHLSPFFGETIEEIQFVSWINLSYQDLLTTTGLQPGMILDSSLLTQAVRRLQERDSFESIVTEIEALPEGVQLRFRLKPRKELSSIRIVGTDTLEPREVRRLARLRPGTALVSLPLDAARQRIQGGYQKAGHYRSQVHFIFDEKAIPSWTELTIAVDEGYHSKISRLTVDGELPDEVAELRTQIQEIAAGQIASEQTIERLRNNLLLALRREGYLQATVEVLEQQYQTLSGDVDVTLGVEAREPMSIVFLGNQQFSPEELLAPLKLETRTVPFTPNAMLNLAREIEELYQQHGYYRASAHPIRLGKQGTRQLFRIDIDEGVRYQIENVLLLGASRIPKKDLYKQIATRAASTWPLNHWQPGFVRYEVMDADVENLKAYYASFGFFDTEVTYDVKSDSDEGTAVVVFTIEEGPQRLVQEVDIQWEGVVAEDGSGGVLPLDIPRKLLTLRSEIEQGDPFSRPRLREEQRRLYDEVVKLGYPNASVELQGDANRGSVRFIVTPGSRVRIGRIVLQGNILSRDFVLERELTVTTGGDWNNAAIERSKQNLASLGYFRSVRIEPLDGALQGPVEDMAVAVVERDTGRLEIGGGFTTEDGLRLFSEIGQRNLYGRGNRLLLGVEGYFKSGGDRVFDAGRVRAAYAVPKVFDTDMELSTEAFLQSSVRLVDQFSYDRVGAWLSVNNPLSEHLKGLLSFTGYQERLFDVDRDVIIGPFDRGRAVYTFLQSTLDLDLRDNLFNPRKGLRTVLDARLSTEALGSELDFYQLQLEQSVLFEPAERLVWANRMQWYYFEPFGDTEVIPISQRIFLGGKNSLRGFSKNSIGPRGKELNIVGGDRGYNATTELRYDISESIVGLLFLDVGQTFLANEGTFRGDTLTFSDTRFSPGVGVHYTTPIGPIRAEYGVALDREFGERFGRLNISIGTAF